jgi:tRNA 2-(methylsulfanyl)-N6-isopentenyladenosine37 hydroxylase
MRAALELAWPTPAAWADAALAQPLALLSDHAYCELGAAAAAQGLLARRPEDSALVERLGAHASEELRHFRQVHRLLVSLGGALGPVRKNPYAEGLLAHVERGAAGFLDRLLVFALIERRSLERFELLAAAAGPGDPLGALYRELAPSEAGHAALFVELARERADRTNTPDGTALARRLARWIEREAALLRTLPSGPRIHSGWGAPLHPTASTIEECLTR